jgi:enamine deaminase RidA (YjgF/YER057c/UK114 family)
MEATDTVEAHLRELGIALPRPPKPIGAFRYGVEHADVLYLSGTYGTVPDENDADVLAYRGRVGAEVTLEEGYQSARLMAINLLAMAKAVLGTLDRVTRVLRLEGFVNGAPGFRGAPKVINGASDLLIAAFGPERGSHARSSLYQPTLTADAPVAGQLTLAVRALPPA